MPQRITRVKPEPKYRPVSGASRRERERIMAAPRPSNGAREVARRLRQIKEEVLRA